MIDTQLNVINETPRRRVRINKDGENIAELSAEDTQVMETEGDDVTPKV